MKTKSLLLSIVTILLCLSQRSIAQLAGCASDVPFFSVNLAGNPSGVWTSPNHSRQGLCYAATSPDRCTSFQVLTDTGAAMIKLEIISGATPSGSMYYQVDGGPMIPVATPISISGVGPFNITFCKPGNNKNTYRISTMSHATASIAGIANLTVCSQTTLSCGVGGGTWSSSNTSVASVNASTGVVTGVTAGTADIIYTINSSTVDVVTVTVNPLPAITGNAFVCGSGTTVLANTTTGGTWSSSNTAIATVSGSGVVSGVSSGTATISYNVGATCRVTKVVSVNPTVSAITGTLSLCAGSATTLANTTAGGTWSSAANSIATINASGIATGVAAGTVNITYQISGGCRDTRVLTVNAAPASITGAASICLGNTTTLNNTLAGGVWSSANSAIATVNTSGVVSSVAVGTTIITYSSAAGCTSAKQVTINAAPSISGIGQVCDGQTITLSSSVSGGTWSSAANGIATINASGIATGASAGTVNITYTVSGGCRDIEVLTVNAVPASITGTATVCLGNTTTLNNTLGGGTWSSANSSIATVSASGVVSSVAVGTTTITYSSAAGCTASKLVTINATPSISGIGHVCDDQTITLSSSVSGGTWSSGSNGIATINASGIATGASAGTVNITYTVSGGCRDIEVLTVNAAPAITGSGSVCIGSTATLYNSAVGGAWTSGDAGIAVVDSTGAVTTVSVGVTTITYTTPGGCQLTKQVTVNTIPSISGIGQVCDEKTITLTGAPSGGTWSSANGEIATVNPSGIATGKGAGAVNITYQLSSGCKAIGQLTVNPSPSPISGPNSVCEGASITLSNGLSGGMWSSGDATVAVVDSNGVLSGVDAGSVSISYSTPAGCTVTKSIAVNTQPSWSGIAAICENQPTTLTGTPSGGNWHSGDNEVATVNSVGVLTGNEAGTTNITYQVGGCKAISQVTVNASPSITGSTDICSGLTTTFSVGCGGGNWACADTTIGTIDCTTGVFHTNSCGSTTITYATTDGCSASRTVTVTPGAPILGKDQVCKNLTTTLSCSVTGGHWDTHPHSVADITDFTGILHGKDTGTVTISYTTPAGCIVTRQATVNQYVYPLQTSPITTPTQANICVGTNLQLNSPYGGGGVWSTTDTTIATVTNYVPGSSVPWGLVTGHSAGTVVVSYTALNGCVSTHTLAIHPMPTMSGTYSICRYSTTTLSGTPSGGQWFSQNGSVATIAINTGVVTAYSAGTATMVYRLYGFNACSVSATETVNACTAGKEDGNESAAADDAHHGGYDAYPNPGNGRFTIRQNAIADGSVRAIVVNYMGQPVYNGAVSFAGGLGTLDLPNVVPGLYLVQLEGKPGEQNVLRIAVEK